MCQFLQLLFVCFMFVYSAAGSIYFESGYVSLCPCLLFVCLFLIAIGLRTYRVESVFHSVLFSTLLLLLVVAVFGCAFVCSFVRFWGCVCLLFSYVYLFYFWTGVCLSTPFYFLPSIRVSTFCICYLLVTYVCIGCSCGMFLFLLVCLSAGLYALGSYCHT